MLEDTTRGDGFGFWSIQYCIIGVATDTTFLQSTDFIKIKMLLTSQHMHLRHAQTFHEKLSETLLHLFLAFSKRA